MYPVLGRFPLPAKAQPYVLLRAAGSGKREAFFLLADKSLIRCRNSALIKFSFNGIKLFF